MLTKRGSPRKAWRALVCRKEFTHPVTSGLTFAPNSWGLIGARRAVRYLSLLRIVCWAALAGKRERVGLPLGGLWRLTNCTPRKSKPSVKRVARVLSRLSVRSIRVAIASKAARAGRARLRQTSRGAVARGTPPPGLSKTGA